MMTSDDLTCQQLVELVTSYVEGTLTPADRARFEGHLASCQGCRNYLDQMRKTIAIVGKLSEDAIAPEAQQQLLDAFRNWKRG
jgi:anti-sigma factor RsiW